MKHLRKVSVAPADHCADTTNLLGIVDGLTGTDAIGCVTELLKIDDLLAKA